MLKPALLFTLLATPIWAEDAVLYNYCGELWFIRNQIFDNAGYCFSTPLGQTMFDNSDCTPGDVSLSSFERAMVESLRAEEAALGCAVDTSQTTPLAVPNLEDRRETPWLGGEMSYSMCIGWLGGPFPLHVDPSPQSAIVGLANPGDNLSVIVSSGGWFYYYVMDNSEFIAEGWADRDLDWSRCESNAG